MDTVFPARLWDQSKDIQDIFMDTTFRFDDVLDASKLKAALQELLKLGEWRKVGSRLRKNGKGVLVWHVPQNFSMERPGFNWTQEDFEGSVSAHPVASRVPNSSISSTPSLFKNDQELHDLVVGSQHITSLSAYTETDRPQISVHLVTFADATFLTLVWPHAFMDIMGMQSMIRAWLFVLNGDRQKITDIAGFETDPSNAIARAGVAEDYVLYKFFLVGIWFWMFVAAFLVDLLLHRKESNRLMCLPGPWIEDLKGQCLREIELDHESQTPPFLSDGDVILAWVSKVIISAQKLRTSKPVAIYNIFDLRGIFEDVLPRGGTYLGNAVSQAIHLTTAGKVGSESTGRLALHIRRTLIEQRRPEQVESFTAAYKASVAKYGRMPICGYWDMRMIVLSNAHRARLFDLDFSNAVVCQGRSSSERATRVGQPAFVHSWAHTSLPAMRNHGSLIGRDAAGNWWLNLQMRESIWADVEAHFEHFR